MIDELKLNQQIKSQIEGETTIYVRFSELASSDDKREAVKLYAQWFKHNMKFWIKPLFCNSKQISEQEYKEINKKYGDDDDEIKYDDFFNKYYNKKGK